MTDVIRDRLAGGPGLAGRPEVVVIDTPSLGDRSYVVHLDGLAVVVDPQRDTDRVEAILAERRLTVTHVLETHIHNDYVTGGLVLSRAHDAQYVVPVGYDLRYEATRLGDGDRFTSGRMQWRAVHTPGHTPQHLSYVVAVDGDDLAAFTGGSMLYGSVGRPDLIGPDRTHDLAHAQWHSVRRLAAEVAADAEVFPTHGFGSFCSATATVGLASTIGEQAATNPACTVAEDRFVAELIEGLDVFPAYYAHMTPANQAGPGPVDLSLPQRADPTELRRRLDAGEWVVDLRSRQVFADGHLRGTLSFDSDGNVVTYLGWLIPWGAPLTLLGATRDQVTEVQRELVRIGIDRPAAYGTGAPADWALADGDVRSYRRVALADLDVALAADPELIVVDARRRTEWQAGHVAGARLVPLHDLPARRDEVATWSRAAAHAGRDATVWIYCGTGFRSAVAASLLDQVGVPVVHVDDEIDNGPAMTAWTVPVHVAGALGAAYAD